MTAKSLFDSTTLASPAKSLGAAFGVEPEKAQAALDLMSQALTDRVERNTLSRGGIADLFDILARPGAGAALANPANLASPQVAAAGDTVLEVLLGSKHASRGVAAQAARATGIDEETLKRMLPAVASLVVGALQKKAMPQIEKSLSAASLAGSPLPLPGEGPIVQRPSAPIDMSPANIPRSPAPSGSGGTMAPQRPLPLPGDDIPGIDGPSRFPQLPDVIRRRGREIQVPDPTGDSGSGAGPLDGMIRDILANVLGFKNGGIIAFILKLLFSRWFMGLVGRILRGVLGGGR